MISLTVFATALIALFVATAMRPSNALVSVISLDVLDQWAMISHPFFAQHSYVINLVVGGLVAMAVAIEFLRGRARSPKISATWIIIILLFAYSYVSFLWAPWTPQAAGALRAAMPYLITYLLLAPILIRDVEDLKAPWTLLLAIGPVILTAIIQFGEFGFRGLIVPGLEDTNPMALATYGALLTIAFVVTSWRNRSIAVKLGVFVIAFMGIWIIVRSQSRGPLIAAAASLLVVWMHVYPGKMGSRLMAALFGALSLGLIGYLAMDNVPFLHERWAGNQMADDLSGRFGMTAELLAAWWSDPITILFGLGNSASYDIVGFYPHMVLPETLAEEGVVGFLALAIVVALTYRSFLRLLRGNPPDSEAVGYVGLLFAYFLYLFLMSFKQGHLLSAGPMLLYAILIANLEKCARLGSATSAARRKSQSAMQYSVGSRLASHAGFFVNKATTGPRKSHKEA